MQGQRWERCESRQVQTIIPMAKRWHIDHGAENHACISRSSPPNGGREAGLPDEAIQEEWEKPNATPNSTLPTGVKGEQGLQ